ncbi:MAG: acetylxylan esterase [Clostridia bacterium]|nr:acetylxylan esterase [Clostridia bacterium]
MKPDGLLCHDILTEKMQPKLSYNKRKNYEKWKKEIREKFIELTGLDQIALNACEPELDIEKEEQMDGYRQIKFSFYSEVGAVVPCYLLIPDTKKEKYPVVITLQGHSTGYHNSVGQIKFEEDKTYQPRGQFAIQAAKEGYIALAIEQRAMGERSAENTDFRRVQLDKRIGRCYYESITATLLGRTVIGERCWDISRAIDVLSNFPECDTDKIVITGNSGGGTASYYATCYDERIKVCMPSSAFCPYKESILRFYHCSCNYIPHAYKYFDMQDLACLIAPRKLLITTGELDPSFLVSGVQRGYETVKEVYKKVGAEENSKLIVTHHGHWWEVDIMWPELKRIMKELNW